ncbi:GNAT family N-acetyltransferase [Methylosinus sp. LW3]|jgi:GNAT superfamily N-acetyltransferase|uniref:GNAT family N-acetyltransferase n=1 Tax=Methylosinus sp. LW3 TaxID=107635 RepID=UPI0004B0D79B|nr:GNAT family N-acetyltransferase [Methylosinus sp. LW3]
MKIAAPSPPRPLRESDDRSQFDCGRASLNDWFRRRAWINHLNDVSRVNVMTAGDTGLIVAYVAMSAAQIERAYLPKPQQRNRPDPVPVLLLGQLAVDKACQGRGYAADLLFFAFETALRVSEIIGGAGLVTHPLDDKARSFYARWGFCELPYDPRRAMIIRMADLRASFAGRS